jgi:uncharacterized UPF0160 family protein
MNDNLKIMEHQSKRGWGFFEIDTATEDFVEAVAVAVEELTGEQTAITKLRRVYLSVRASKKWANGLIMVVTKISGHEVISEIDKERIKESLKTLIKNKA